MSKNAIDETASHALEPDTGACARAQEGRDEQEVKRAIEESFIRGFRVVVLIASALALLSALFAWLLIEGRALPAKRAAREARLSPRL